MDATISLTEAMFVTTDQRKSEINEMNGLTPKQQAMLVAWQAHTYAEFALKDADAALATMSENPCVLLVASGTVASGRAGVRAFYAEHFLPHIPPDFELCRCRKPLATTGSSRNSWFASHIPWRRIRCCPACPPPAAGSNSA